MRKRKQQHTHIISASHDLTMTLNIPADQLAELEQTYRAMLEAITNARREKEKSEYETAEILKLGISNKTNYDRTCLKIAHLEKCGNTSKQIDMAMDKKNGYCLNRCMASHGRSIKRDKIQAAKKRLVLLLINSGFGVRETARLIPQELGRCSPSLVCKIVRADKLRRQAKLPFTLYSVAI